MWTHPAVKQFQLSVSSPDANKYPSAPLHETRLCLRSLLSKHFLPTRAIYRFLPWSGMVSLSLFLSASLSLFFTSKTAPPSCVQQLSRNKVIIIVVLLSLLLVVTVSHWLPWCVSRLCSVLPCEHHDICCKQTRIDSLQIPTYLPFIIGNSSNLMLLCFFWNRVFK